MNLLSFFRHPAVGILGSLASVIAIPLSIYLYLQTKVSPKLTYYVHPVRATVVKGGTASSLSVNFKGKPITSDITAAQIAIWNAGRMPIKHADVLSPILIRLTAEVPLLEASIRKVSREVTKVTLDETTPAQNEVGVHFDILEQSDGCVIQLIYAGSPDVPVMVSGVIIGQHSPQELRYGGSISSPAAQYVQSQRSTRITGWSFIVFGSLGVILILFLWHKKQFPPATWSERIFSMMPLMFLVMGIIQLLISPVPEPPFGFP